MYSTGILSVVPIFRSIGAEEYYIALTIFHSNMSLELLIVVHSPIVQWGIVAQKWPMPGFLPL